MALWQEVALDCGEWRAPSCVCNLPSATEQAVSVVVPARNCAEQLRRCLHALRASQFSCDFELIVVDDASSDSTPQVAEELADRVLRFDRQQGPAAARNCGVAIAHGPTVVFVDADVCVAPDTLSRLLAALARDPGLSAVFGSYDTAPAAGNIVSQYRNLLHHHVHQTSNPEASTFWSGCGAIKRAAFNEVGGYDVCYRRPCVEDIELGARLRRSGHRIALDKTIQVTHLKRWTLGKMLYSDIFDRAIPWTRILLTEDRLLNDLNVRRSQRVSALLAFGLCVALAAAAWQTPAVLAMFGLGLLAIPAIDAWSTRRRVPTSLRCLATVGVLLAVGGLAWKLPLPTVLAVCCALAIVLINHELYRLLARERHPLFAAFVFPLHVMYFIYSSLAFMTGVAIGKLPTPTGRWTIEEANRVSASA